jgi:hypothetical protein
VDGRADEDDVAAAMAARVSSPMVLWLGRPPPLRPAPAASSAGGAAEKRMDLSSGLSSAEEDEAGGDAAAAAAAAARADCMYVTGRKSREVAASLLAMETFAEGRIVC